MENIAENERLRREGRSGEEGIERAGERQGRVALGCPTLFLALSI